MAAAGPGASDMADRGAGGVDKRWPVVVIRDEAEVHAGDAPGHAFESAIVRLLEIEQSVRSGLYRLTIIVEQVADEGEAYVAIAAAVYEQASARGSDRREDTRDAGLPESGV